MQGSRQGRSWGLGRELWLAHPRPVQLQRFMGGGLQRLQRVAIVRHLLAGCPQCVCVTRRLWNLAEERAEREASTVTDAEAFARIQLEEIERELQRIRYRMLGVQSTLPPSPVDRDSADVERLDDLSQLHAVIRCVLQDAIEPAIEDLRELAQEFV